MSYPVGADAGFAVLGAIVVAELLLSWSFNKFYFTFGIPLFRREITCAAGETTPLSAEQLELRMPSTVYYPLSFRQLDEARFGFRERFWSGSFFKLHYTPLMHGLLAFDHNTKQVRVTGFANLSVIAFVAFFVVTFSKLDDLVLFGVFLVGLLAVLYSIQASRFGKVAQIAADSWASDGFQAAQEQIPFGPSAALGGTSVPSARDTSVIWRILAFSAVGVVLVPIALMVIGTFTEEWTCREAGSDWKCVGGRECNAEATKRIDSFRRTVRCERTDWPMVPMEYILEFVFPSHADDKA
jgi:hypothetical protein